MALSIIARTHCVDFEQEFVSHCPATKNLGKYLLELTGYLCLHHRGWLTSRIISAGLQHRCGGTEPRCYHLLYTQTSHFTALTALPPPLPPALPRNGWTHRFCAHIQVQQAFHYRNTCFCEIFVSYTSYTLAGSDTYSSWLLLTKAHQQKAAPTHMAVTAGPDPSQMTSVYLTKQVRCMLKSYQLLLKYNSIKAVSNGGTAVGTSSVGKCTIATSGFGELPTMWFQPPDPGFTEQHTHTWGTRKWICIYKLIKYCWGNTLHSLGKPTVWVVFFGFFFPIPCGFLQWQLWAVPFITSVIFPAPGGVPSMKKQKSCPLSSSRGHVLMANKTTDC